jgi:hypothetical protein
MSMKRISTANIFGSHIDQGVGPPLAPQRASEPLNAPFLRW